MENKEDYQSGEQMDLPGTEEIQSGEKFFDVKPEESENKEAPWQPSELGKKYEDSLTSEDRDRDKCQECGGSGDYCPICIAKGLIPDPRKLRK